MKATLPALLRRSNTRSRRVLGLAVVALCTTLVAGGCGRSSAGDSSNAAGDIRVAYVGDVTGPYALLGAEGAAGFHDAIADINAAGGIDGRDLVVDNFDSQADANAAQTAWRNAFATNPQAIFFSGLSSSLTAGYPTMVQQGIPVLAASSTPDAFKQDWFFSAYAEPEASATVLVDAAKQFLGGDLTGKTIAVVGSNTPAVVQQLPLVAQAAQAAGSSIADTELTDSGIASFATQAQKIADAKPDAVVTLEAGDQVTVTKDLVTAGVTGPIIGSVGGSSAAQLEAINAPNYIALRDVISVAPGTELYAVAQKHGSLAKATSNYYVYGYAFGKALGEGLKACGADCSSAVLAKAIHDLGDIKAPNYVGPLNFDGYASGLTSEVPYVWNSDKKAAEPAGAKIFLPGR